MQIANCFRGLSLVYVRVISKRICGHMIRKFSYFKYTISVENLEGNEMILFMVFFFTTLVSIIGNIMHVNACSFKKIGYMPFHGNRKFMPIKQSHVFLWQ